jgi:hypothetical protein
MCAPKNTAEVKAWIMGAVLVRPLLTATRVFTASGTPGMCFPFPRKHKVEYSSDAGNAKVRIPSFGSCSVT